MALESKARNSQLEVSTGANTSHNSSTLFIEHENEENTHDNGHDESSLSTSDSVGESLDDDEMLDNLFNEVQIGNIDPDQIMSLKGEVNSVTETERIVSAAHAKRSQGVTAEYLSKIWRLSLIHISEPTRR